MKLENLRKKSVLVALISFVVLIANTYGLFKLPDNFNDIVNAAFTLLTLLGIIIE
jgi:uncharacterized membrane protein